jgi:hypothetical protein
VQRLPIARYDQVGGKQLIPQLSQLSQVELAAVEAHERSHRDRPVVLNRLRWLTGNEPLPGYDALDSDEIVRALADADAATVKAVRSYERHHRDRRDVRAEIARILPTSQTSAGQDRAREQMAALVQAGTRSDPPATRADLDARQQRRPGVITAASTAWTHSAMSGTSESGSVTKRAIGASASSSIGRDSTAGARPARANSGSCSAPPTAPLPAFAGRKQQPCLHIHPPERRPRARRHAR